MNAFSDIDALIRCGARVSLSLARRDGGSVGFMGRDAYPFGTVLDFTVCVPRAFSVDSVVMRLYRDDDMSRRELPLTLSGFGDSADIYSCPVDTGEICLDGSGLFYYDFELTTPLGKVRTNQDGSVTDGSPDSRQLLVYPKDYTVPERFAGGMMYQIFPDRFAAGGKRYTSREELTFIGGQKRVINPDWETGVPEYAGKPGDELDNNEFFGGSIQGIIDNLDYIKSLGVRTIYLNPIFEAASNHRYDTGDYMRIDPLLGDTDAFEELCAKAKEKDMLVILDGVFGHTGADSVYFNRFGNYPGTGAYQSKRSLYSRWYDFRRWPDDYRCWWGVKILPQTRTSDGSFVGFICGKDDTDGVVGNWLNHGAGGWRLDVADELSDKLLSEIRKSAKRADPEAIIIGEVWEDASNKVAYSKRRKYFRGGQLDSVMNYPLKDGVTDYVMSGDKSRLYEVLTTIYPHYPEMVGHVLMNFLGTHDTERILTVLAGVGAERMTNAELAVYRLPEDKRELAENRLRLAWSILCALPGMPCVYYGDERGMEGGRDPFNRMPFVRSETPLTDFYREAGRVRNENPALLHGDISLPETGDMSQILIVRRYNSDVTAVAANMSDRAWDIETERRGEVLLSTCVENTACAVISDNYVTIPPRSVVYIGL